MAITSLTFIFFVGLVVVAFNLGDSARYRHAVLAVANIVFIASQVGTALALLPLLIFVAAGYPAVRWLRRGPLWGLALCLVLTIAAFIVLKRFAFLDGRLELPFPYLTMGLSYCLFRLIHLLVDAQSGELPERINPLSYFNYNCNFLCFVSGPIQRYQDFAASDSQPVALDEAQVFRCFARVIGGFVKVAVVSAALNYLFGQLSTSVLSAGAPAGARFAADFSAAAVLYTLYLYFNFSGYMDIVIGIGGLLGQRLPENFEQPFAARNFLEFWTRWHITLSEWFKTYLFNPLLKALAGRFRSASAMPWLGVVSFFVTFLVMGLWHGTTAVFVVYGLLLGGGAGANKLWQLSMTRRLGKAGYRALAERAVYRYLCRGATFAYFALALTCLWVDLAQLGDLLRSLGLAGVIGSFVLVTLAGALAMLAWSVVGTALRAAAAGLPLPAGGAAGLIGRNVALAAQVLLILMASSFFHKAPEFVYRAF
ncbi:MBOAT family O-acyltransferase [Azonexus sp. IMCC34842]|uniref:MBOAT family O-acyltransferase n=1 Tax=Azonexus sp. IMCC34842 TaxID=3420950 RepID=UPI003D141ED4